MKEELEKFARAVGTGPPTLRAGDDTLATSCFAVLMRDHGERSAAAHLLHAMRDEIAKHEVRCVDPNLLSLVVN